MAFFYLPIWSVVVIVDHHGSHIFQQRTAGRRFPATQLI
jgi:hypothetical protein